MTSLLDNEQCSKIILTVTCRCVCHHCSNKCIFLCCNWLSRQLCGFVINVGSLFRFRGHCYSMQFSLQYAFSGILNFCKFYFNQQIMFIYANRARRQTTLSKLKKLLAQHVMHDRTLKPFLPPALPVYVYVLQLYIICFFWISVKTQFCLKFHLLEVFFGYILAL